LWSLGRLKEFEVPKNVVKVREFWRRILREAKADCSRTDDDDEDDRLSIKHFY
jgi:hypothetical protein